MQELSAIAMRESDQTVVSVYHRFAYCPPHKDEWSRRHVHGLDPSILIHIGFVNETYLISDFKRWLSGFHIVKILGNDSEREAATLQLHIDNLYLPCWVDRVRQDYHMHCDQKKFRDEMIFDMAICFGERHHLYRPPSHCNTRNKATYIAKLSSRWHCSLYDVYELYLYYCQQHGSM